MIQSNPSLGPPQETEVTDPRDLEIARLRRRIADLEASQELAEQAQQSHKLEAIARLAGSVAHDFNNLLTAILGYGQLLERQTEGQPVMSRYVGAILEAGERAGSLIRHLLAFSRRRHLRVTDIELDAMLRDLAEDLTATLGEELHLRWRLDAPGAKVHLDPGGLRQTLLDLVINAREAMPDGGTVLISSELVGPGPSTPDSVRLTVWDTGVGMDEATRQQAFEPFFTTKDRRSGGGQGLSSVYGFVTQSAGRVSLDTAPGAGTRVVLDFPLCQSSPEESPPIEALRSSTRARGEHILVVEDEEAVRELVCDMLVSLGYRVSTAVHGLEALEILETDPVDLLLSDVVMPKMGGIELIRRLGELFPDTPVALMSGYTGGDPRAAQLDPAIPFLAKPFRPNELAEMVRQVLDGAMVKA